MKAWWGNLNVRERLLIAAGGAFSVALFFYVLVWEPFQISHRRLQQTVAEHRADLAWMQRIAENIKRLRGPETGSTPTDARSLLTVVDQTVQEAGMGTAMKRVTPQSDDRLSAQLDSIEFNQLISWINKLENQHNIIIANLTVDRTASPGVVNARLVLERRR